VRPFRERAAPPKRQNGDPRRWIVFRRYWVLPVVAVVAVIIAVLAINPKGSTVYVARSGETVTLHVGDTLEISLEGNPTTGYGWELAAGGSEVMRQVGESSFSPESDLIGAGGTYRFTFDAEARGQTDLELWYRRSWEADVAPAASFTVHVVVER
jgi:predicted secreted protein